MRARPIPDLSRSKPATGITPNHPIPNHPIVSCTRACRTTSTSPSASLIALCAGNPSTDGSLVGWKAVGVNSSTVNALVNVGVDNSSAQALSGAFMLNAQPSGGSAAGQCWSTVNQLLDRGVKTKTCAEYFGHTGKHMQIKFVPCS